MGDANRRVEMGKMLDDATFDLKDALSQMKSKHEKKEKVLNQRAIKAQMSEAEQNSIEELILISGDEAKDHRNLVDYPIGPMRVLKPAPKYHILPSKQQQLN